MTLMGNDEMLLYLLKRSFGDDFLNRIRNRTTFNHPSKNQYSLFT